MTRLLDLFSRQSRPAARFTIAEDLSEEQRGSVRAALAQVGARL